MTTYMVFEPPADRGDRAERAERIVFVPDRFSWGAFLLAPLWMLWRRLWLVFVAYLVVMVAVTVGLRFAGVPPGARFLVGLLISLLVIGAVTALGSAGATGGSCVKSVVRCGSFTNSFFPDGRVWGSTSETLVALASDGRLRYDFQPAPPDPATWYAVDIG